LSAVMPGASWAGCKAFTSAPSNQTANVDFINDTDRNVKVGWFDFKGQMKVYRELAPGQSYVQPTFTHHIWAVTDAAGNCLGTFVVVVSGTYIIKAPKAQGGAKAPAGKQI
jgi:hypothetical protein